MYFAELLKLRSHFKFGVVVKFEALHMWVVQCSVIWVQGLRYSHLEGSGVRWGSLRDRGTSVGSQLLDSAYVCLGPKMQDAILQRDWIWSP